MGACGSKIKLKRRKKDYKNPVRSLTAVSGDSAYFDGNCASVHVASYNQRNKYPGQQSTISKNDYDTYETYETLPGRDEALFQTLLPSRNTDETDCAPAKNRPKRSPVSEHDMYLDMPIPRKAGKVFPEDCECCTNNKLFPEMIPYMIEVFLPLLQKCIRVLEVIPHLPFIEDTETFRNKDRDSPRQAVVYLIDRVRASEEPGKWQALLEALSTGGYKYICDLLKGETEKDLTNHRKLLRLFTPRLVNRIEPQEFVDHLYEKNVIGMADMEEIRCEERNRGPIAASLMLLELVPRKNPDWYDIFVDVLTKCGLEDMVDDFHIPEKQERASSFRPFSRPELVRHLNAGELHVQDNRRPDNRRPEADRDYTTPTYYNDFGSEEHNEDVQEASSLHFPYTDTVTNNTTGVDEEQKLHVFKVSESQTNDSDVTLCQILQRVEDISLNLAKLREILTEIQKMKTNRTHETKFNDPTYILANSYDISKLDYNSLPVPHLRRTSSLVDSGAFCNYVSTAIEYYV